MLPKTTCPLASDSNGAVMRKCAVHIKSFISIDSNNLHQLIVHGVDQIKWEFRILRLVFGLLLFINKLLFVVDVSKVTVALVVINLSIFVTSI
jgi:hypothetical protein